MLTRAVAKEEGRYGLRANSVAPGVIDAGLGRAVMEKTQQPEFWRTQQKRVPLRRYGEAGDVAARIHRRRRIPRIAADVAEVLRDAIDPPHRMDRMLCASPGICGGDVLHLAASVLGDPQGVRSN